MKLIRFDQYQHTNYESDKRKTEGGTREAYVNPEQVELVLVERANQPNADDVTRIITGPGVVVVWGSVEWVANRLQS
jgi:hypothetical protein